MPWRWVSLRLTFDHKWLDLFRQTQRQISCERDESASVEKTVAFYRQIPRADAKTDTCEPFAASANKAMSALIDHEHSDSPTIVDYKYESLVTATLPNPQIVDGEAAAAAGPSQPDNIYRYVYKKKTGSCFARSLLPEWLAVSAFAVEVTQPAGAAHGYPGLV